MFSIPESARNRFGNTTEDVSLAGQALQAFRPVPSRNKGFAYQPAKMLGMRANPFTIQKGHEVRPGQMPPMSRPKTVSAADQSCLASKALVR